MNRAPVALDIDSAGLPFASIAMRTEAGPRDFAGTVVVSDMLVTPISSLLRQAAREPEGGATTGLRSR
jgi:hypothetical protein